MSGCASIFWRNKKTGMRCRWVEVLEKAPGQRGVWDYERVRPSYYIYIYIYISI
jgi:hypothetical protein